MNPAPQRPIRILRIIARLNIGGPAIHVTLLTEKLGAPNYDSRLVCGTIEADEGDMLYFAEKHGVHPLIMPELGRSLHPLRDIATVWKLYKLMRELKPDIVHTHTAKAGFVGRLAAWLAGVPVIATHSDAAQEVLRKAGGKTFAAEEVLSLVQMNKTDIAQTVFGTSLSAFRERSRAAYSGQQMLEEYVSFYQNL